MNTYVRARARVRETFEESSVRRLLSLPAVHLHPAAVREDNVMHLNVASRCLASFNRDKFNRVLAVRLARGATIE